MWWSLDYVTQGALQRSRAVDDHSHPRPGTTRVAGTHMGSFKSAVWPTCDDVLYSAILALVHGPVVFGLPLAQLCDQLLLLLPLLLGLDLNRRREDICTVHCAFWHGTKLYLALSKQLMGFTEPSCMHCTLGSCCLAS